ncbi:DUF3857 and transglutaminase domain-containing protein [Hymenobacter sp. BT175]|uniref:DUF3857 and transglutaminase domain-containing protein n=1 Tax=Hymenobacter translucens TaxID=2886507 RepID=UPI001D0DF0D7|nr:DUF3857 and transglutaminase domain-containing protein [Hymenobacter translucens]MCC2547958.1 DUF3857 and transglutaminase domain-containing protein [Hymenobacter translucens]
MASTLLRCLSLAVVLGCVSQLPAFGQADPIKFGKVELKDLDEKNFVADSAAEAVILCDYGRSRIDLVNNSFRVSFERVTRIKILKKSGYDWATVKVPLYKKNTQEEKLVNLRGFTYNVVGGQLVKDKLESTAVFSEQLTPNNIIRKFTMPNVREGSIIEYTYIVNSDFLFNFQDWQFEHEIPVRWSEYRVSIPEYFDYKKLMQGYQSLAVQEHTEGTTQMTIRSAGGFSGEFTHGSGREQASTETLTPKVDNFRWAMKDLPAFREEPYMTTANNFMARINFELAGTKMPGRPYINVAGDWNKISKELLEDDEFGGQLSRGGFLKDKVATIVAQHADPQARIAAIHDLARKSVKYNGMDRLYASNSLRASFDKHSGNSADVNLLLIALLREAGLTVHPLVLSTRSHGMINTSFVMLANFNYVVASVVLPDNKQLLVDATEDLAPCGMLPARCLNGAGRLVLPNDQESAWVDLTPSQHFTEYRQINLVLDEKGGLSGKIHHEHGGYSALYHRGRIEKLGEKKYVEEMAEGHEGWSIPKYTFAERATVQKPLAMDYEFTSPGGDAPAGTLYLNPLRSLSDEKNPFVREGRMFPVDFGAPMDETLMVTLTLPAGYVVEELPKPIALELPDNGGRFVYNIAPNQNTLQIVSRLNLRKAVYSAEEYASLREFYTRALAKQAEQIVLKKKS